MVQDWVALVQRVLLASQQVEVHVGVNRVLGDGLLLGFGKSPTQSLQRRAHLKFVC